MLPRIVRAACCALTLAATTTAYARDYYFSPLGEDTSAGDAPERAMRSLQRVSALRLQAGDRVLLQGGARFEGSAVLDSGRSGEAGKPIELGAYGKGPATIAPPAGRDGVVLRNLRYWTVHDLRIEAAPADRRPAGNGVRIQVDGKTATTGFVTVRDLDISGFGGSGLLIESLDESPGAHHIRIERVHAHDNDLAGIQTASESGLRHTDLQVLDSEAYRNRGLPGRSQHSGNGIILGQVSRALVERSRAWENGIRNEASGGPVGIWAWDSDHVIFRNCVSFRNRTSSTADGGGFDFDGGVTDSLMENNKSFENDGAGYLLSSYPGSEPARRNVIRNNLSQDDGRNNGYSSAFVYGTVSDSTFEGNTFIMHRGPVAANAPAVVSLDYWQGSGVRFKGNTFVLDDGLDLLRLSHSSAPEMSENRETRLKHVP